MPYSFPPRPIFPKYSRFPLRLVYQWKNLSATSIDYYGNIIVILVKTLLIFAGLIGLWYFPFWVSVVCWYFAWKFEWINDGKWFPWSPVAMIDCTRCGGSGFSGYGSGYDAVCDWCGGTKKEQY